MAETLLTAPKPILVGVDGGKSKTVGLLADQHGKILGWGRAGNSDKYLVGLDRALGEIAACVREAARLAGITTDQIACGCFGLAGADWPEDFQELESGLRLQELARTVLIKNDTQIALRANTDDGAGVVISGGTHLAAAIRTPAGEEWFSGWYSVEGLGGVRAGYKILWAVLQAVDGRGQPTVLTDLVLKRTAKSHPEELLRDLSLGKLDEALYASLAPLLFQAYKEYGDALAEQIILEMAFDMSRWATGLLARFELLSQDLPVILSGGLFRSENSLLIEALKMHIHARAPRARVRKAHSEPVVGGLLYAYECQGIPVSAELLEQIQVTLPGEAIFRTD